jgi:hypothetical protein
LVNGLIHNLNGPLQNIAMDLEMMLYSLPNDRRDDDDLRENLMHRFERMEGELDRMSHLIRSALRRGGIDNDLESPRDLNEFCEQELEFLKSNLYFKHNVRTELELQDHLPPPDHFDKELSDALGWLLRGVVDEVERQRAEHLLLRTRAANSAVEMLVSARGKTLSPEFLACLDMDMTSPGPIKIEGDDPGVRLAAATLKARGVSLAVGLEGLGPTVIVAFPSVLSA